MKKDLIFSTVKDYMQLFRVHHYIKNILVFIPLFFSLNFFNRHYVYISVKGFVIFSLLSSVIYIVNDIQDREKDRLHSSKRFRPLASGKITVGSAIIAVIILSILLIILLSFLLVYEQTVNSLPVIGMVLLYVLLNLGYSYGLKNIPILDITILASGYVIRVLFGAFLINVDISVWLYLTITMGAYYLGLGKRRNEIIKNGTETRAVMRFYSHNFLDKNMYLCQVLCLMFYALWSIDAVTVQRFNTNGFVYTIPLVLVILFKYNLNIETDSDGDPTSVILHDKILVLLCAAYMACAFFIIYANRPPI
jgi:4-hydroxybenzoate polyprenyltransferase